MRLGPGGLLSSESTGCERMDSVVEKQEVSCSFWELSQGSLLDLIQPPEIAGARRPRPIAARWRGVGMARFESGGSFRTALPRGRSCGKLMGVQEVSLKLGLAGPVLIPKLISSSPVPQSLPRWNFQFKSINSFSRAISSAQICREKVSIAPKASKRAAWDKKRCFCFMI